MPRGDGTGPNGQGPMTGRGAGFCAGYNTPGYANPAGGMGRGMAWRRGRGGGFGRGWGNRAMAAMPPAQPMTYQPQPPVVEPQPVAPQPAPVSTAAPADLQGMRDQADFLRESLAALEQRITELESNASTPDAE